MNYLRPRKQNRHYYDIQKDAFVLVLQIVIALSFLSSLITAFIKDVPRQVISITFATLVISVGLYCCFKRGRDYKTLSIFLALFVNCVLVPVYILYGSSSNSGAPIWFAAAIVMIFFMIEVRKHIWILILVVYVDIYFFIKQFSWNGAIKYSIPPKQFTLGVLFAFISTALTFAIVIVYQEINLNREKKEIDQSRDYERRAGEAKARFLANMSHEIRTPMNSIIGLSELMLKDEMDDVTKQEVMIIKDSAYDLLDIIDDVLMYSKLDAGKLNLVNAPFNISKMLKTMIDTVSVMISDKKLKMRIKIDHNIPKIILGDELHIRQIFSRILFVSIALTENGRIMMEVKAKKIDDDRKVKLECKISDTGMGLAEADLHAVFGAYDTYDSRQNSNLKGIGLKYSVCRELLKLMGGELEILSIEGVGLEVKFDFVCDIVDQSPMITLDNNDTKKVLIYISDNRELGVWKNIMEGFEVRPEYVNSLFKFDAEIHNREYDYIFVPEEMYSAVASILSLYKVDKKTYVICDPKRCYGEYDKCRIIRHPVSCLSVAEILNNKWDADDYSLKLNISSYDGSKAKILVVDDNGVNIKVAMGIFKQYKIDIDVAKSGAECLEKMAVTHYDLVFMDMVMPEMSGLDTLIKIRESNNENMKNVPVIALTAESGGNVQEKIMAEGFSEYLAKPIKPKYLTNLLISFLPNGVFKVIKNNNPSNDGINLTEKKNELNTNKGLANIAHNEDSYCAILNTYYSEGVRKVAELPGLLKAGEISAFTTDVHGIKSSSASIGADTVSLMFKELEAAGKEGNLEYINERYEEYSNSFIKILEDVKNYLEEKGKFNYLKDENVPIFSGKEETKLSLDLLKGFKENVDKMDLKQCDVFIEEVKGKNYGKDINERLTKLIQAYEMFDFHTVKLECSGLLNLLIDNND